MNTTKTDSSSFRDPSGFIFYENGKLFRQINLGYREEYDHLISSGLYEKLISKKLLISHQEAKAHNGLSGNCYKVIEPEMLSFISYPYEWCFSQLKDSAITTLRIMNIALKHNMILKDASAYNVQFRSSQPIFIDTLSFEIYKENQPWKAYRQFVQHFLAPLSLMSYTDIRLNQLFKVFLDGIPLDLASRLLPVKTRMNISLLLHIHAHARAQRKYESKSQSIKDVKLSKRKLLTLIESLWETVQKLKLRENKSEWVNYYSFTNYSDSSFNRKKQLIRDIIAQVNPGLVWDIGANTGEFTKIAAENGSNCIAFDIDPLAVESHYLNLKKSGSGYILPLILDIANPSPSIGWHNKERGNLEAREKPGLIMALALVHHLSISNGIPFEKIAEYFNSLSEYLIIEFVPKDDSQVQILLSSRDDVFHWYTNESFVDAFENYFEIVNHWKIDGSQRILYLMRRTFKNVGVI
jgi:ribosomal protein L11 methylase PrmA